MRIPVLFFALATLFAASCQTASGNLSVQILQIGDDVLVTSQGSIDTSELLFVVEFETGGYVQPNEDGVVTFADIPAFIQILIAS